MSCLTEKLLRNKSLALEQELLKLGLSEDKITSLKIYYLNIEYNKYNGFQGTKDSTVNFYNNYYEHLKLLYTMKTGKVYIGDEK